MQIEYNSGFHCEASWKENLFYSSVDVYGKHVIGKTYTFAVDAKMSKNQSLPSKNFLLGMMGKIHKYNL